MIFEFTDKKGGRGRILPMRKEDLDSLFPIYQTAVRTIGELGIDQWQNGYPTREILLADIAKVQDKIGEIFEASVSSVASFGMFAVLENTCEGLIPMSTLDGAFTFDEKNVRDYHTYYITIGDLCKYKPAKPLLEFLFTRCPVSPDQAITDLSRIALAAGTVAVSAKIIKNLIKK